MFSDDMYYVSKTKPDKWSSACTRCVDSLYFCANSTQDEHNEGSDMEDSLDESRPLLNRYETSFSYRFRKCNCSMPSDRFIAYGLLVGLLLSISLLLAMNIYSNSRVTEEDEKILAHDDLYNFSGPAERKLFYQEWKNAENLLMNYKNIQSNLAAMALSKNVSSEDELLLFANDQTSQNVLVDCALISEHLKRKFKQCMNIDIFPDECKDALRKPFHCNPAYPYRNIDGSCNNLANPRWGMAGESFLRWLKPDYADDVSIPRMSVYGVPLPNSRLLSDKLYSHKMYPDANTTMMMANFGLYLDHDLIQTGLPADVIFPCCSSEVLNNPQLRHVLCWGIDIPREDSFYSPLNVTCMNFVRNSPSIGSCPGRREQFNRMTSSIDASDTYGSNPEKTNSLRSYQDGKLRISVVGGTPLLPINHNSGQTCHTSNSPHRCFLSGDTRANMHMELMVSHTVWLREHNRLTDELKRYNPHWSDEMLFQEARRIVIAKLQIITYREFLPLIFSRKKMEEFGLKIDENKAYDGYDETLNIGVHSAFSAAAFRFGHSLIQDAIELRGPKYKLRSVIPFHETYLNPTVLYNRGYDDVLRGMVSQKTHNPDRYVTKEVRNRLLQRYNQNHGHDLSAISIERGRDHGLPGYTKWRSFCGLSHVTSWEDMYSIMDRRRVDDMRELYMSVDDVDLIPAALSEKHEEGSFVGPTYVCLLGKQFHLLRHGDRFWFENPDQPNSFTKYQLKELYKTSMARLLCDTSDSLEKIQKNPFLLLSEKNPMLNCKDHPKLDMSVWLE